MAKKQINRNQSKNIIIETRIRRFFALLIDWYITQVLFVIPITFYLRNGSYLTPDLFNYRNYPLPVALALLIYGLLIGLVYYILIPVYLFNGQTIGKKICHIKIVNESYSPVTIKTILMREIIGSTLIEGGIIITASKLHQLVQLITSSSLIEYWQYLCFIITIISIIYAYMSPKSQSFHDKIAKTLVIKV